MKIDIGIKLLFLCLGFSFAFSVQAKNICLLSNTHPDGELAALKTTLAQENFVDKFGGCFVPPSYSAMNEAWDDYSFAAKRKISINAKKISIMPMPFSVAEHITHITRLKSFIEETNKIVDIKWVSEMLENPIVLAGFKTQAYFDFVKDQKKMDELIQEYQMTEEQREQFDNTLKNIRHMMEGKSYVRSIDYAIKQGLSIFDMTERNAILEMNEYFIRNLNKNNEKEVYYLLRDYLAEKTPDVPLKLANWPLIPKSIKGEWAKILRNLIEEGILNYLFNNKTGDEVLDNLHAPVEAKNPFEEWFEMSFSNSIDETYTYKGIPIEPLEMASIDHVARTLWGEARGCAANYPQLEAIGRVLADRAEAIDLRLLEQEEIKMHNLEVITSFSEKIAKRDTLGVLLSSKLAGLSDFGRPEKQEIPSVAQATSKSGQFSVWNSYSVDKILLSTIVKQLPKNIPNIHINIRKGRSIQDQKALVNVLCPEISINSEVLKKEIQPDPIWRYIVELATLLVLDTPLYQQIFRWDNLANKKVYFYTHNNVDLPFAVEAKTNHLKFMTDKRIEKLSNSDPKGRCYMRTFVNHPSILYKKSE